VAGMIIRQLPITGSYTVNPDCTGSKQFTAPGFPPTNFDFVVNPNGRKITFIETDAGTVFSGSAVRLEDD
jgi:hypothetical protein